MRHDPRLCALFTAAYFALACHTGEANFPWGKAESAQAPEHGDVHTVSPGYARTRSRLWVREIARPTRAALDYAAYHANFMIADLEPESPLPSDLEPDTAHPFDGRLEPASLTGDIAKTPLTPEERGQPLALAPLAEWLSSRKVEGAAALAEVGSAVRDEKWGLTLPPGMAGQQLSELFLHTLASGSTELWAKVEFQPWFSPFRGSADQDGDGYPEIYGRVAPGVGSAPLVTAALVTAVRQDYMGKRLSPAEVKAWANQLSSYWYPSFNTDLMPVGERWPDEHTEPGIARELGGKSFERPAIVLRGKPQGEPTYNVFLLRGAADSAAAASPSGPALALSRTKPSANPTPVREALEAELAQLGAGDYAAWQAQLAPFHQAVRARLKRMPRQVKAVAGSDGYLFYQNSLKYVVGGDLEKQRKGKNPLPIIVEFKRQLEQRGVDFLFVPVPTKLEVYPEKLDPAFLKLGGVIVNPFVRKFLLALSTAGVEVVDLLPTFLGARGVAGESLYQRQDTHWTDRGLRLAAEQLSARIRQYPWYPELARHARAFSVRETSFTRFGDLQSRLPEAEQKKYTPETLVSHQVLGPDQEPYSDDPESPIVLLGDSFTAVYELMDVEHAGVSAHVARGIGYPLDLVMSYGGGPNVRQKLLRRGWDSLGDKRLVIWMMTARDLYDYWEDWQSLPDP
jgi:SGNH hydrolase-like domain, acetyltransferase AlgX